MWRAGLPYQSFLMMARLCNFLKGHSHFSVSKGNVSTAAQGFFWHNIPTLTPSSLTFPADQECTGCKRNKMENQELNNGGERKKKIKQKASLDGVTCPVLFTGVWSTSGESQKTQSQTAGGRHLGKKNRPGGVRVGVGEEGREEGGGANLGKWAVC